MSISQSKKNNHTIDEINNRSIDRSVNQSAIFKDFRQIELCLNCDRFPVMSRILNNNKVQSIIIKKMEIYPRIIPICLLTGCNNFVSAVQSPTQTTLLKLIIPCLPYVFRQPGLSKQCSPRRDATECGVSTGSTLLATHPAIYRHNILYKWYLFKF